MIPALIQTPRARAPRLLASLVLGLAGLGGCAASGGAQGDPGAASAAYFPGGALPVPAEELSAIKLAEPNAALSAGVLPERYDLSYYFPPPGDQGPQNSCVGWALGYGLMTYFKARQRGVIPHVGAEPALEECYSPAWIYNQLSRGRDGGMSVLAGLRLLVRDGAASWQQMPYDPADSSRAPSPAARAEARAHRLEGFRRVDLRDQLGAKLSLFDGNPILVGVPNDRALHQVGAGVWRGPEAGGAPLHCLLIVGWDDARGAYRVMSSWGEAWGEEGYGWLGYEALARHGVQALVAEDRIDAVEPGAWALRTVLSAPGYEDRYQTEFALELDLKFEQGPGGVRVSGSGCSFAAWVEADPRQPARPLRRVSARLEQRVQGVFEKGVLRLEVLSGRFLIRVEGDGPEPLLFRGDAARMEVQERADARWRPTTNQAGAELLKRALGELPQEVFPLVPNPLFIAEPFQLIGRPSPYGEDLRCVMRMSADLDLALTMTHEGRPRSEARLFRHGERLLLRDGDVLRAVRWQGLSGVGARPLAKLPPRDHGMPVFADLQVAETFAGLWLLELGYRRRIREADARQLVPRFTRLSQAELERYPEGLPFR